MRTKISLLLSVSLAVLAIFVAMAAAQGQNPPPSGPKTAAQEFKNIKVLKDIPSDQLIPAMQFIGASLGVDCEYCHVEHAFEKDDKKPKVTARKMMEMMFNLNRENFEGHREVTCYSCHHGVAKPVSIPVISTEEKMLEMMEGDAMDKSSLPKPEALLDKYLTAIGGADAVTKVASRVQKGVITGFGDQKLTIEIYSKAPDLRVSTVHRKDMDSVTGYNGKTGWMSVPGRVRMMNPQETEGAHMDADLALSVHLKTLFTKLDVEEGEKVDSRATWLVIGAREGKPPVKLYFDRQSGLLLRLARYSDSPLGLNPLQIDFADYRESGGVKIPFRWTQARPGNRFTIALESSEQNVPVDDSKFAVPPPPPAPAH